METLKHLTPAETYLIRDHSRSTLKEMMKLTLADLCLKKAIKIEPREEQPHPDDPLTTVNFVVPGERLQNYQPKKHESIFIAPFAQDPELEILFSHYAQIVIQAAKSKKRFVYDSIFSDQRMQTNFRQGFWQKLMGSTSLSEVGRSTKSKIDAELAQLESDLPRIMETDKKRAKDILATIGGNVFLLKTIDFDLLKEIDHELAKGVAMDSEGEDWLIWMLLFDSTSDFGGVFDGADSSGGWSSGCAGDSGCSGCSGCGGCGS